MSCNGLDPEVGFTASDISEARLKALMNKHAGSTICALTSNKIGKKKLGIICGLKEVKTIVTDEGINHDLYNDIIKNVKDVVVVNSQEK